MIMGVQWSSWMIIGDQMDDHLKLTFKCHGSSTTKEQDGKL